MNNKFLSVVLVLGIASTGFAAISSANDSATGSVLFGSKSEIRQLMDKVDSGVALTAEEQAKLDELDAHKAEIEVLRTIKIKQDAGETLTSDEQTLLDTAEANGALMHGKMKGSNGFGKRAGFGNLTDEEKTAVEAMTDTEKQEFFAIKKEEMQAQREVEKSVIDKLIAGESLTADEEATRLELISKFESEDNEHAERRDGGDIIAKLLAGDELTSEETASLAEMQALHTEREAQMEILKPILEKVKAGEELTTDEQALLDASDMKGKMGKGAMKEKNNGNAMQRGEKSTTGEKPNKGGRGQKNLNTESADDLEIAGEVE